ncbi:MerR family DNA-binding transcriptional regulator [Alteribacillus sp. JSM 102045]|uniref:MerR family transcriptional regulator n=1 Tax=Alteribacillus sp. JSM 102045 TaxID=1562101 RepID=UPI0035BF1218
MTFSISDLAETFVISTRSIRYYEERGLITPERTAGGQRIYSKKDKTRLKLILRGKRFGFSLIEIEEMIELFDADRSGKKQLKRTIEYGDRKLQEINEKIDDMIALRDELNDLHHDFKQRLDRLEKETNSGGAVK